MQERPAAGGALERTTGQEVPSRLPPKRRPLEIDIDHFKARLLQDALTEATAGYWLNRAFQFMEAAPKPGDFPGQASRAQLAGAHRRCQGIALACRRRAQLIMDRMPEEISRDVQDTIDQVT